MRALGRLGPDGKAAAPALLDRLRHDKDAEIRTLSAKTLGLMGPAALGPLLPETVAGLIEGLKNDYTEFREYSARALGQLARRMRQPLCAWLPRIAIRACLRGGRRSA